MTRILGYTFIAVLVLETGYRSAGWLGATVSLIMLLFVAEAISSTN